MTQKQVAAEVVEVARSTVALWEKGGEPLQAASNGSPLPDLRRRHALTLRAAGRSQEEAAREVGVDRSTVACCNPSDVSTLAKCETISATPSLFGARLDDPNA